MKGIGRRIYKMDMVSKLGLMDQNTKEIIKKAKSIAKALILGVMDLNTMDNGLTIK